MSLCCEGGCLVYPGIFSSSLGLYPLYAKQLCQLKMFPDVVRCLLGEGKTRSTLFENHWFMGIWELPLKYSFYLFMYSQTLYLSTIKQIRNCINPLHKTVKYCCRITMGNLTSFLLIKMGGGVTSFSSTLLGTKLYCKTWKLFITEIFLLMLIITSATLFLYH